MSDFTKGEWEVIEGYKGVKDIVRSDSGFVASTQFGRPKEENEANAHLIAASPMMREALKALFQPYAIPLDATYPEYPNYWGDAAQALAAAEEK